MTVTTNCRYDILCKAEKNIKVVEDICRNEEMENENPYNVGNHPGVEKTTIDQKLLILTIIFNGILTTKTILKLTETIIAYIFSFFRFCLLLRKPHENSKTDLFTILNRSKILQKSSYKALVKTKFLIKTCS